MLVPTQGVWSSLDRLFDLVLEHYACTTTTTTPSCVCQNNNSSSASCNASTAFPLQQDAKSQPRSLKVALQFPDALLPASGPVYTSLASRYPCHLFLLLSDSTFSPCCVDWIAASHGPADVILHFGPACMTHPPSLLSSSPCATSSANASFPSRQSIPIPVYYIYGREWHELSLAPDAFQTSLVQDQALIATLTTTLSQALFAVGGDTLRRSSITLHLKSECEWWHIVEGVTAALTALGSFAEVKWDTVDRLYLPTSSCKRIDSGCCFTAATSCSSPPTPCSGTRLQPRVNIRDFATDSHVIVYVGGKGDKSLEAIILANELSVWHVDPREPEGVYAHARNRVLMRRFHVVDLVQRANVFGIVLGPNEDAQKISKVKAYLSSQGKESFLLSMGTPTPQKLGNFLQVDVFILMSCPSTSLLSSREFIRPIVTLGELELGMEGRSITEYAFDHPVISAAECLSGSTTGDGEDEASMEIATRSGGGWAVAQAPSLLSKSQVYYTGLDPTVEVPVTLATEGRVGLARGYSHEEMPITSSHDVSGK